jgi:lipid-A-disaccharide synthase
MKHSNIVVVAGEASGDHHAAELITQLKLYHDTINFSGIGGIKMQQAGANILYDLAQFGVTGLTDVIKQSKHIFRAMQIIKRHLNSQKPDLLILIDYPGFNLRLAKFAKSLNIKVIYYISPQIWAWKAGRIKHIKKYVDHMAVIFPFEKKLYETYQVPVSFVGHPLVSELPEYVDKNILRQQLQLPLDKTIIALLPGSRIHEIDRHMPIFIAVAKKLYANHKNLHFVIPRAHTVPKIYLDKYLQDCPTFVTHQTGYANELVSCADYGMVASGTASLEAALRLLPMCIVYKTSWLSFYLGMKFIKIKYLGLCNILSDKMLIPEFIQDDCNPDEIFIYMNQLLTQSTFKKNIVINLNLLKNELSSQNADDSLTNIILKYLTK